MNFNDKLNEYIELIGCTNKQLSDITGIAPPIISGYRKGNRIPKYNSAQFIFVLPFKSTVNVVDFVDELILLPFDRSVTPLLPQ